MKKYGLYTDFAIQGNSSFCLPFICNSENQKNELEKYLNENGIESRPLCSGNLLIQPFLKNYTSFDFSDSNVNHLHTVGFFIGNNHLINSEDFDRLDLVMNNFFTSR
jgi:CDP-6-deoxy-D-xylo-4-hexulose-3-dehydrase